MRIVLAPGVAPLLRLLDESAITVELTVDFEQDAQKSAVVFPGASDPALGYQRAEVDGLSVWWRQRLLLATRAHVTTAVRPRRVRIWLLGRAFAADAEYA